MIKGYVISDIHFGAVNSNTLYDELEQGFLKKLKSDKDEIDLVVINGDLIDHKLSFNSIDSKVCINFINKLILLSKKKNFALRLVKGTRNHDLDQLNNFSYLQKRVDIDFKIINTVTEESINGSNILYIPEEYMEDAKEYYSEYFSKEDYYDLCFVHGTFNHVEYVSKAINSERPMSNAPIFSYKEFSKFVKGPVLCGHVHIASSYKKKVYYTGSYSRWKFGEDKKKGYMKFIVEDDSTNYEVKFIENKLAPKYETIYLEEIANMNEDDIKLKIKEIDEYKKDNNIEKLRVIVNNSEGEVDLSLLHKYFNNREDNDVKISMNNTVRREEDEDSELEKTYDFIFKNNLNIYKTISKYLKIHDNITLSESVIEELLTTEC